MRVHFEPNFYFTDIVNRHTKYSNFSLFTPRYTALRCNTSNGALRLEWYGAERLGKASHRRAV